MNSIQVRIIYLELDKLIEVLLVNVSVLFQFKLKLVLWYVTLMDRKSSMTHVQLHFIQVTLDTQLSRLSQ